MTIMESLSEKDETVGHLYVIAQSLFEDAGTDTPNPEIAASDIPPATTTDVAPMGTDAAQAPAVPETNAVDGTAAPAPAEGDQAGVITTPNEVAPTDVAGATSTGASSAGASAAPTTPDTGVTPAPGAEAPSTPAANPERKAELIAFAKEFKQYKDMINADGSLKAEAPNEARSLVEKNKVNNPTMAAILQAYNKADAPKA